MSIILTYGQAGKDPNQLHDAMLKASLVPERVESDGTTIWLTFPDGTVEADVDAVVAAHIPKVRYDLATRLASQAVLREASRLRADYRRLEREGRAVVDLADVRLWLSHIIAVLERRDRANGLY